jgi:hypothetical protein
MLVRNATHAGETSPARDAKYSPLVELGIDIQFSHETGRSNALIELTQPPSFPPLCRLSSIGSAFWPSS